MASIVHFPLGPTWDTGEVKWSYSLAQAVFLNNLADRLDLDFAASRNDATIANFLRRDLTEFAT